MKQAQLECVKCGRIFSLDLINTRCPDCDEPLEVRYDLKSIPRDWFKTPKKGCFFERYAPFYSFLKANPALSLGEGQTSLLRSNRINEKIGLRDLFFKNETQNPTWTFKDRGTAFSIQNASSLGYRRFGTLSSGNMGASVAAFGSRARMDTFILLKANVPREKIDTLTVYGAKVIKVSGNYGDVYYKALEVGKHLDIYFSISDDPMRIEGYKSLAFEVYEQMEGQPPDYVAVPVGSGGLCRGVLKGFEELDEAGFIDKVPKFIGVQTQGCSPTVDAYEKGKDQIQYFKDALTLDHVLENPYPPSGNQVIRKMRSSGGVLLKVSNKEILDAELLLAEEGIFAQPASATALAGLIRAVGKGLIPADSSIVTVVTGSGLKYPPVLKEFNLSSDSTSLDRLAHTLKALIK
ncbi:MAG: threonine synthase [Desulfobacteraceae bacterium]|nr:MAG: threonine synthase [Desulfobacteraceae bacterium]